MPILLIATLDTKGLELAFVRDRLRAKGLQTLVVDAGSLGSPTIVADVNREELFRRSGSSLRGDPAQEATEATPSRRRRKARRAWRRELASKGELEGVLAIGGSAGSTIGIGGDEGGAVRDSEGAGEHAG